MNEQDQRVRDYYQKLSLPQDKLELLLKAGSSDNETEHAAEQAAKFTDEQQGKRWFRFNFMQFPLVRWLPAAMACTFVILGSLWLYDSNTESEHMLRTVREVAMNHTTRLEPEYRGESLSMLDNSMQQLPFALVLPKSIDKKYKLIGSRYCSLGGVLAAHVRLKSSGSGRVMSLFVTSNSAELDNIRSQQTTLEGVDVEFWREGGLFYALAQRS